VWGDIVDSGVLALFGRGGDGFAWGRPYAVLANPMYMELICSSNSAKQGNTWKPASAWSTQLTEEYTEKTMTLQY
jgi:ABC-type spermidine/putrescine transport system permease subunit II